ncbi:unnamed protein product [Brachionus calyciflorus]|uniref:Uncharacterized protein n=1 Tax=Brachionus calyciflorus TaxID=104777 RepID=A0A813M3X3_9BILA|nr:unnamed protein product [Brachionus calyciflorus]
MVAIFAIPGAAPVALTAVTNAMSVGTSLSVGTGGLGAALSIGGTSATIAGAAAVSTGGAATTAIAGAGAAASASLSGVALAIGPVGLAVLGASKVNQSTNYDCWKPILRDNSSKRTNGMLLKHVLLDKRVKEISYNNNKLLIKNVWNEEFEIEFFKSPSLKLLAHAKKII